MKTLKIGWIAVLIMVICTLVFLQSCQKEETNYINTSNIDSQDLIKLPKITFKLTGKFHRGAKWSKRQNPKVKPCTQGFGICDVGFDVSVESRANMEIVNNGDNNFRINFLQDLGNLEGEVFMSNEDEFIFPSQVSSQMGYSYLEIVPNNYIAHMYPNSNFGYVDIVCTGYE